MSVQLAQPTLIARPLHREGWVYEEKVDGWRMLAYKVAGTVKLMSRNGRDHSSRFPGIVARSASWTPAGVTERLHPIAASPK